MGERNAGITLIVLGAVPILIFILVMISRIRGSAGELYNWASNGYVRHCTSCGQRQERLEKSKDIWKRTGSVLDHECRCHQDSIDAGPTRII